MKKLLENIRVSFLRMETTVGFEMSWFSNFRETTNRKKNIRDIKLFGFTKRIHNNAKRNCVRKRLVKPCEKAYKLFLFLKKSHW